MYLKADTVITFSEAVYAYVLILVCLFIILSYSLLSSDLKRNPLKTAQLLENPSMYT